MTADEIEVLFNNEIGNEGKEDWTTEDKQEALEDLGFEVA